MTNYRATGQSDICLRFGDDIETRVRSRVSYVFRVFAAIYNYKVVNPVTGSGTLDCYYGRIPEQRRGSSTLFIPARYRLPERASPAIIREKHQYAGEDFLLAYGVDEATGNPDWLGEIFEWLASASEIAVVNRDPIGRIPYSETIFRRQGIDPRRPHANLLMAWMENALQGRGNQVMLGPSCPVPGVRHLVLCSHDVDFCYNGRKSALLRVLKNVVLSWTLYRSPSFLMDNLEYLVSLLQGNPVGDYLPTLMDKIEELGFRSTFFVVPRRQHRRDPNYDLSQIAAQLIDAVNKDFPVGLHGSYRSIIEDQSLSMESEDLARAIGKPVVAGRQHWLRFDLHRKLFHEIGRAGLILDSSLGFTEAVGFRNGAAFPFPPYDFGKEAPCEFLECPLALMDGSIAATCRASGENPQDVADQVLNESRRWGWGGIAVLWHDPVESLQVPREINQVFWRCAQTQGNFHENWLNTDQLLLSCLERFQEAGLLQATTIPATESSLP